MPISSSTRMVAILRRLCLTVAFVFPAHVLAVAQDAVRLEPRRRLRVEEENRNLRALITSPAFTDCECRCARAGSSTIFLQPSPRPRPVPPALTVVTCRFECTRENARGETQSVIRHCQAAPRCCALPCASGSPYSTVLVSSSTRGRSTSATASCAFLQRVVDHLAQLRGVAANRGRVRKSST